eukprot:6211487-Pleurochrysis_carterae.AAC.1
MLRTELGSSEAFALEALIACAAPAKEDEGRGFEVGTRGRSSCVRACVRAYVLAYVRAYLRAPDPVRRVLERAPFWDANADFDRGAAAHAHAATICARVHSTTQRS